MSRVSFILALLPLSLCYGQVGSLGFSYRGATDPAPIVVGATGTIAFPATQAGSTANIQFFIANQATATIQITSIVSGSSLFTVTPGSATLDGGKTGAFTLAFLPKTTGVATTALTVTTADGSKILFNLRGSGVAPQFVTSFILNPDGNQTGISDGGTILFPTTLLGQSATATMVISNTGTGAGTVGAVNISGPAFKLTGLPLLPAQLEPGLSLRFTIAFTPTTVDSVRGTVQLTLGDSTIAIALAGQGSAASLSYAVISGTTLTPVSPNGTISFADTNLGATSALTIQVRNSGTAPGSVGSVTIVGQGFQVSNLVPLPVALAPGATMTFSVNFVPTIPGPVSAKLLIDSATFNLSGNGQGSQLTYTFIVGSSSTTLTAGGTATFPNTVVGSTVAGTLRIQNSGNVTATVNSVSVTGQYFGATIPPLPAQIAAGASLSIPLSFVPNALGTLTGTLGIDNQLFSLRGIGTAPPGLPSYSFTGVADTTAPATQPAVGLALASAYPTDITGTLTLTFVPGSFSDDPAIQFATGGRTVAFRIPANTTNAIFSGGASTIAFQTGTVAGNISITPAFLTGTVSITPIPPVAKSITIAAGAPVIRNVQIGTQSAGSFEVLISGFATSRTISQVTLQFTPAAGANLQTTTLTVNADSAFSSWYQSAASAAAGSQFTASVIVTASGSVSSVASVGVTMSNANGNSNSMSAAVR